MVSKASDDLPDPLTPGEDDELAVRQREVDALQVVGAGAADDERAVRSTRPVSGRGVRTWCRWRGPDAAYPKQPCYYRLAPLPITDCPLRASVLSSR